MALLPLSSLNSFSSEAPCPIPSCPTPDPPRSFLFSASVSAQASLPELLRPPRADAAGGHPGEPPTTCRLPQACSSLASGSWREDHAGHPLPTSSHWIRRFLAPSATTTISSTTSR
ncbi:hypothetical protein VPH35_065855 [Triticum aestivum]